MICQILKVIKYISFDVLFNRNLIINEYSILKNETLNISLKIKLINIYNRI